jgi:predicted transposase/invertase (TIGR01784 family)
MNPNDKYANPTLDWSFKKIFLSPGHDNILRAFLNDVLQGELDVEEVQSIKGLEQTEASGKKIIYDIHCKSKHGELFIIEIQRKEESDFFKRLDYYRCRALSGQIKESEYYEQILPVIVIAVCEFPVIKSLFPESSGTYFEKIYYTGSVTKHKVSGPPQFILLDLSQYKKQGFPTNTFLEDWFQLFTCKAIPHELSIKREEVKRALDDLTIDKLSLEEQGQMEVEGLAKAISLAELRTAKEQAAREGEAKGKEVGLMEGKILSAKQLIAAGLPKDKVLKSLNITEKDLKKY